jgi:hypothetical protein
MSERVAATYVTHDGREYLVSTIDRPSSVVGECGAVYTETMVWAVDDKRQRVGGVLMQDEDMAGSVRVHCEIVRRVREVGPGAGPEEEDG